MKNLLITVLCLLANITFAQTILKSEDLQKDFAIVRKSYEQMHPGLYKYQSKEVIDKAFEDCKTALNHDQSLAEAYLNFHELTSKFQCGHAYPNFYNQGEFLKKELFEQKVCLPFQFQLIEDRMLITRSADSTLSDGIEVKTINGITVSTIIKTLLPIVRADGSNDAKRRKLLEIGGQTFEYFDIFFPMYFPLKTDSFELQIYDFNSKKTSKISVKALNRIKRNETLKAKYPDNEVVSANFKWLNDKTAIMQINNLAIYNKAFDFDKFYLNSADEYTQKQGKNLIIDIRKCEGGNTSEMIKLVRYLSKNNIEIKNELDCWAYIKIDTTLKKYVDNKSWAFGWFNMNEKYFTKLENGQYRSKDGDKSEMITPEKINLEGNIYLMTSATNSSAGYIMADIFKKYHLATLVGQTTGGNQRGITAGAMFFMSLPNTKIEVDVPLIGMNYDLAKTRPDAGLSPDVYVKPNIMDAVKGIDTEMEVVKKLIAKNDKK
jgi:hypothetical protein